MRSAHRLTVLGLHVCAISFQNAFKSYRVDTYNSHTMFHLDLELTLINIYTVHQLILLDICAELFENQTRGLKDLERTRKHDRQTNKQMDRRTDRQQSLKQYDRCYKSGGPIFFKYIFLTTKRKFNFTSTVLVHENCQKISIQWGLKKSCVLGNPTLRIRTGRP